MLLTLDARSRASVSLIPRSGSVLTCMAIPSSHTAAIACASTVTSGSPPEAQRDECGVLHQDEHGNQRQPHERGVGLTPHEIEDAQRDRGDRRYDRIAQIMV